MVEAEQTTAVRIHILLLIAAAAALLPLPLRAQDESTQGQSSLGDMQQADYHFSWGAAYVHLIIGVTVCRGPH